MGQKLAHVLAGRVALPLAAFALIGCSPATDDDKEGSGRNPGTEAAMSRDSFATGSRFVLPFSTTLPDGLAGRVEPEAEVETLAGAVRFTPRGGGENEFLRLVVLGDRMGRNDAVGLVRSIGTEFGIIGSGGMELREATPPPGHAWAFFGYRLTGIIGGERIDGWISLGEREERFFYVMALYPESRGAALEPLFDAVLANWVWHPGGSGAARTPLVAPS